MGGIISTINTFVPFADPTRPIWVDIVYSIILCTLLWLGPQLQNYLPKLTQREEPQAAGGILDNTEIHEGLNEDVIHQDPDQPIVPIDEFVPEDEDAQPLNDADFDMGGDIAGFQQFLNEQAAAQAGPADLPPARERQPEQLIQPVQPARQRDPHRPVGAKKARSLARRQQVRAYHEFLREQSDVQRAQDASTREEREAAQAAERKRRQEAEARIRENEEAAREAKRVREKKEREEEVHKVEMARTQVTKALESHGIVKLEDITTDLGRDKDWLVRVLKTEGVLGTFQSANGTRKTVLITGAGYIVKIEEEDVKKLYEEISRSGGKGISVNSDELGSVLSAVLLRRHQKDIR